MWGYTSTRRIGRWSCAWTRRDAAPVRYCPCARDRWNGAPMITCVTAPLRCSPPVRKFLDNRGRGARRPRRPFADNYATHKTALIRNWLAKRPRFHILHTHQRLLAEPGGALVRSAHRKAVAPHQSSAELEGSTAIWTIPNLLSGPRPPTKYWPRYPLTNCFEIDLKRMGLVEEHHRPSITGCSGRCCPLISSKISYY